MQSRLLIPTTAVAAPVPVPVSLLEIAVPNGPFVHVIISAAGSVQMMGRNSPTMAFTPIGAPITVTGITLMVAMAAEVQAVLTGNTGNVAVAMVY